MRGLGLMLCAALGGCGDDGSKSPSDVTSADLRGLWQRPVPDIAPPTYRYFSFHQRADLYPSLVGTDNVYKIYDVSQNDIVVPHILGTYEAKAGELLTTGAWGDITGPIDPPQQFGNQIIAFSDKALTIREQDGSDVTYTAVKACDLPVAATGWRTERTFTDGWSKQTAGFGQPLHASTAFDPSGGLIVGVGGMIYGYFDGDCMPDQLVANGAVEVREAKDGVHVIEGAQYMKLAAGHIAGTLRPIPLGSATVADMIDVDGLAAVLLSDGTLLVDNGTSFDAVPITSPSLMSFKAEALAADGSTLIVAGNGVPSGGGATRPWVATRGAGGFTFEMPFDQPATGLSIAATGGDVWLASAFGIQLWWRHNGAWTPINFNQHASPRLRVKDGSVYLATATQYQLTLTLYVAKIAGSTITEWIADPRLGDTVCGGSAPYGLPTALAIGSDGTLVTGYCGQLAVRRPGDDSTEGMAPVKINITGTGRVTSSDGLVDCTATCTVMAPYGRVLDLHAANGTFTGCPTPQMSGVTCDVAVVSGTNTVSVQFP